MTSAREKYLAMMRVALPGEIEEAKARHPQLAELLDFLLGHIKGVGAKTDASDQRDLDAAERRLAVGLNGLWQSIEVAAVKGFKDEDEFARHIHTVAMCAFVIGSRASISSNSKKHIKSEQAKSGQTANASRGKLRYEAFEREIGPMIGPGDVAKITICRIEQRKAADQFFAEEIGSPADRTIERWIERFRRENGR